MRSREGEETGDGDGEEKEKNSRARCLERRRNAEPETGQWKGKVENKSKAVKPIISRQSGRKMRKKKSLLPVRSGPNPDRIEDRKQKM